MGGRFVCFACGAWGYLEDARQRWREEQQRQAAFQRPLARQRRSPRLQRAPQPASALRPASHPPALREPVPARPDLAQQLAAFQAALPGSRGAAYLQQRGIPLALAQRLGVGAAAPDTWPHAARDWRGGRVVFPHTTPDGRLVNLYGRAVGTAEQVPKTKRHDHLPGEKGYFHAAALQAGAGPLFVCEGAFDALAQQAALRGKRVAVLPAAAYGGYKDVNEAWMAGVLNIGAWPAAAAAGAEGLAVPEDLREAWDERMAIMEADGGVPHAEAERLAWAGLQAAGTV